MMQWEVGGGSGSASSPGDRPIRAGFRWGREQFESLVSFLDGSDAADLSHAELEERLDRDGRELLRRLLDDHLALRGVREARVENVVGDEGVSRGRVEAGHTRALETVFGAVSVERLAYRAPGVANLHPADAALNLPVERHAHGLRKLAALEAARGSFQDALEAIERQTGQRLGKRQVEELATLGAIDFEDFYAACRPARGKRGDLLVLSADGKGIVMRPDALRTATAGRRARAGPKPKARLAGGETLNHKRMAEIGAVYDATPAPRTPADLLASAAPEGHEPAPGAGRHQQMADRQRRQGPSGRDRTHLRGGRPARPQAPPHLGRARGRCQPPDPTDQVRGQETQRQGHDRR
jgi:hypothetical protein